MFRANTLPALACLPLLLAATVQSGSCRGAGADKAPAPSVNASTLSASAPTPAANKTATPGRAQRGPNRNDNAETNDNANTNTNADTKDKMNDNRGAETERVAAGTWGGVGVRLMVREDGAAVQYDCARGTIDGPLTLDAEGRFDARGAFVREHPGPIRLGVPRVSRPARYSGKVTGDEMTLTVTLTDTSEALDALTLTRGGGGRLVKCR